MSEQTRLSTIDPELKAEWVSALRSGEYKQGGGQLASKDSETNEIRHCCLGVLKCVVGLLRTAEVDDRPYYGEEVGLPEALQAILANLNDGVRTYETIYHSRREWAKDNGLTYDMIPETRDFNSIADFIEKYV